MKPLKIHVLDAILYEVRHVLKYRVKAIPCFGQFGDAYVRLDNVTHVVEPLVRDSEIR